jgi:peptide deformylase
MIIDRHNFKLRYMGDDVLNEPAKDVEEVHDGIKEIINKMIDIMYFMRAFGLAANQVGVPYRMFVMDVKCEYDKKRRPINKKPIVMINPKIIEKDGEQVGPEGCLSIPGQEFNISRADTITVQFTNLDGDIQQAICTGLEARCVQHEIDHLDGKLVTDYIDEKQKMMAKVNHQKIIRKMR